MTTTINNKAQVSLPSDTAVRVTRDFRAPRKLVWRAHTEPELFQRWIGGYPGWSMPVCEMDVRPGGKYRWRWRSDEDGKEFGFHGDYREVDAPREMVQTEYYEERRHYAGHADSLRFEGSARCGHLQRHGRRNGDELRAPRQASRRTVGRLRWPRTRVDCCFAAERPMMTSTSV